MILVVLAGLALASCGATGVHRDLAVPAGPTRPLNAERWDWRAVPGLTPPPAGRAAAVPVAGQRPAGS